MPLPLPPVIATPDEQIAALTLPAKVSRRGPVPAGHATN
jgi:hypothetical protein